MTADVWTSGRPASKEGRGQAAIGRDVVRHPPRNSGSGLTPPAPYQQSEHKGENNVKHIEAISNGLGAPSVYMVYLATQGKLPATVSITADTGGELDRVWSNGERTTAREYWERIVVPMCEGAGIEARFVRTVDRNKKPLPGIMEHLEQEFASGGAAHGGKVIVDIPLYGSEGGQLKQTCTSKWKIGAIRQELRRMGATTARCAQGLHTGEMRRMKGAERRRDGEFWTYTDVNGKSLIKWSSHYYPLIDMRLYRNDIRRALTDLGIPYLESSECDFCPHKDRARWFRTSPEMIERIAVLEEKFGGEFFFTDRRKPLREAIEDMRAQSDMFGDEDEADFGCGNAVCGV